MYLMLSYGTTNMIEGIKTKRVNQHEIGNKEKEEFVYIKIITKIFNIVIRLMTTTSIIKMIIN